jgi:hypothetical protein
VVAPLAKGEPIDGSEDRRTASRTEDLFGARRVSADPSIRVSAAPDTR